MVVGIVLFTLVDNMRNFNIKTCRVSYMQYEYGRTDSLSINITIAAAAFSMLSSLFHVASLCCWKRYTSMIRHRYNLVRWAEYSISAALMAVIIDLMTGMNDVVPILYHAGGVSVLMWAGLSVELLSLGSNSATAVTIMSNLGYTLVTVASYIHFSGLDQSLVPLVAWFTTTTMGLLFSSFGIYQGVWQGIAHAKRPNTANDVSLKVYDLSFGLAKGLSDNLINTHVDIIPHLSVNVYGTDIFVMNGIQCVDESDGDNVVGMPPSDLIKMGHTKRSSQEIVTWLNSDEAKLYKKYDLFNNDCLDFAQALCRFLDVSEVPADLMDVPAKVREASPELADLWKNYDMKYSFKHPPPKSGVLPGSFMSMPIGLDSYIRYESGYCILSLVSKTMLTYLVLWAGLSGHEWTEKYSCSTASCYPLCSNVTTVDPMSDVVVAASITPFCRPRSASASASASFTAYASSASASATASFTDEPPSLSNSPPSTISVTPSLSVSLTPSPSTSRSTSPPPSPTSSRQPATRIPAITAGPV